MLLDSLQTALFICALLILFNILDDINFDLKETESALRDAWGRIYDLEERIKDIEQKKL